MGSWKAIPDHPETPKAYNCPTQIKQKIEEERRLRRLQHRIRTPERKRLLNPATELLNNNKNDCIQTFLKSLTRTESTDYCLWKATKKLEQVKKHLHQSGHHKEPGHEPMQKKQTLLQNTYQMFSNLTSLKVNPKWKKRLSNY
jgi:hypothetical protein